MENLLHSFFTGAFGAGVQGQGAQGGPPQQAAPPPNIMQQPPPASKKFVESLVPKAVTEDDIQEINNKECLICLDDHEIGALAVKLPCGHLFHKACVSAWLVKHCTCPACRYEVECGDPRYEIERRRRMQKTRKIRVRLDEFKAMKISEIRKIATQIGIDISDCIDKNDIIDKLVASESVDLIEGVPMLDIPEEEWEAIGVKGLKQLLKGYGISDKDALMKSELRNLLLNSGRIRIMPSEVAATPAASAATVSVPAPALAEAQATASLSPEEEEELSWVYVSTTDSDAHADDSASTSTTRPTTTSDSNGMDIQSPRESAQAAPAAVEVSSSSVAAVPAAVPASSSTGNSAQFQLGRDLLNSLSIRELKSIMEAYGISSNNCLERQDLIDRMSQGSRISITED
jgi:hypothetical protein